MSDIGFAALWLAFAGCVGFVIGRKSLWRRVEAAEAAVKAATEQAQDDADFNMVGREVISDAKSCLEMTKCIGDAYGYQRKSYLVIGKRPRVRITFEVEA